MGPAQSRLPTANAPSKPPKREGWLGSLRDTRQGIKNTLGYSAPAVPDEIPQDNIFTPIQQDDILSQIPIGRHHPVPRTGVEDDDKTTMYTNSFYANSFLGQQNQPIWTHPYSIWWGKWILDVGILQTWGMCITHIEEKDLVFEPGDPAKGYINPLHKQHLILSAVELDARTTLTTDTHLPFSVNINLKPYPEAQEPKITFPVVQGMSFITAGYRGATPMIQTGGRGFVDLVGPFTVSSRTVKYRLKDKTGHCWIVYVNPVANLNYDATRFVRLNSNTILGPPAFKGTIQVAKNPLGPEGEAIYDRAAGAFVCEAKLTAVVADSRGTYTFRYTKIGTSPLLMFVMPHHIQSLDPEMRNQVTNLCLRTTTKGMATAIWGEKLSFVEPNLPVTMHFSPWNPTMSANAKIRYPPEVLAFIAAVAERDLRRAMTDRIPQDSLYFAGKSLARFATIVWIIKDVLNHDAIATAGLEKLKIEMARYIDNAQRHPIYYDDSWKGIVSSAGFSDPSADFGNTYYNDHHIQYAYFVYTAAVIGTLDPAWLAQGDNKSWTNMLVKDFAESDYNGRDYPFQRCFDWWHGHSWVKGLFEAADGKEMGSTGEDAFASYAVKMWGRVVGDGDMEKRGNLQLAIQARSFNNYMYIRSTNTNHPLRYTQNKVAGTLFENKVEHASTYGRNRLELLKRNMKENIMMTATKKTAYFSLDPALIHGIHIVPINPSTSLLRPRSFVKEEWETFFTEGRANVQGGWRGILYANLALIDAKASYLFFRDGIDGFWDERWIDGGASRTLYLVWAAALWEFAKAGR